MIATEVGENIENRLQKYFQERAYEISSIDEAQNQITFSGLVRPSWFLAVFLSFLAACGLLCFGLVLSLLYPSLGNLFLFLTLFAPTAGVFYWRGAKRMEQVLLQIKPFEEENKALITLTAHRDEIIQFKQEFSFEECNE